MLRSSSQTPSVAAREGAVHAGDAGARLDRERTSSAGHRGTDGERLARDAPGAAAVDHVRRAIPSRHDDGGRRSARRAGTRRDRQALHQRERARIAAQRAFIGERTQCRGAARQPDRLAVAQLCETLAEAGQPARRCDSRRCSGPPAAGPAAAPAQARRRYGSRPPQTPRGPARPRADAGGLHLSSTVERARAPRATRAGRPTDLLAGGLVQRVEARLAHESRGDPVEPRLLQREPAMLRQHLERVRRSSPPWSSTVSTARCNSARAAATLRQRAPAPPRPEPHPRVPRAEARFLGDAEQQGELVPRIPGGHRQQRLGRGRGGRTSAASCAKAISA